MLGLAAVAALAAMAFVGATSASASTNDVLCLSSGHHTGLCPAGSTHEGINVLGLTQTGHPALLLENGTIKEECHGQVLALGSTSTRELSGVKILIDAGGITFTSCSGLCTSATSEAPVWLLAEALTLDAFVTADGALAPSAVLKGCPFGVECLYQFTNASSLLAISGDTMSTPAGGTPLTKSSGFGCPSNNMSFDALFLITTDATPAVPLFLADEG
jgi:hypothetical protein